MKARTKISWCDFTINFWQGCTKVSAGCRDCYAETRDKRYSKVSHWGKGAPRVLSKSAHTDLAAINRRFGPGGDRVLLESLATRERWVAGVEDAPKECFVKDAKGAQIDMTVCRPVKPQIFSLSLGDILDPEVPIEWLATALAAIGQSENLEFLLLTKRPEYWKPRIDHACAWAENATDWTHAMYLGLSKISRGTAPNVAWGATVEGPDTAGRIAALAAIPAVRRFVSCEPLLGNPEIGGHLANFPGAIHLVITGGESGNTARPMHPEWVTAVAQAATMNLIPHHFKQWGEWAPADIVPLHDNERNNGNRQWLGMTGRHEATVKALMAGDDSHSNPELPVVAMHRTRSKIAINPALQPRLAFQK